MVRLRPTKAVRVLTFEEKKRVANFFILLVEVDLQKGVTRKRRAAPSFAKSFRGHSKSTRTNTVKRKNKNTQPQPKEDIDITPLFFM